MDFEEDSEQDGDLQYENADNILWVFREAGGVIPERSTGGSYYVYFVGRHPKYDSVYIGSGTGDRYKHVASGISHNYFLNKLHFRNEPLTTIILMDGLSKADSLILEKALIAFFNPEGNTLHVTKMGYGQGGSRYGSPFRQFIKYN